MQATFTRSAPLYERVRPTTLAEVLGQSKAVETARRIIEAGIGGRAVWISGPTGTGKTTLAKIIAASIADPTAVEEYDCADQLGVNELRELSQRLQYFGFGKGGRAVIVNEAHGLRDLSIRYLLGLLERLPSHACFIFTTTKDGEESLFGDAMDSRPLLGRCMKVRLTNQGMADAVAPMLQSVAQREGLDGRPVGDYKKLMQRCKNSVREALCAIESGEMIPE